MKYILAILLMLCVSYGPASAQHQHQHYQATYNYFVGPNFYYLPYSAAYSPYGAAWYGGTPYYSYGWMPYYQWNNNIQQSYQQLLQQRMLSYYLYGR